MTAPTGDDEHLSARQRQPVSGGALPSSGPTVNQRLGLAVISLVFLIFLANIMASLSSSFGPTGSAIGFAAGCLTVLGINVAFTVDVFGRRRERVGRDPDSYRS